MKEIHLVTLLSILGVITLIVALSDVLPFYVPTGNDFCVLTVKVTLDGNPLPNAKVSIFDFLTPIASPPSPQKDPESMGDPLTESFTDFQGQVNFVLPYGNYTVRVEHSSIGVYVENVFLNRHEATLNCDFTSPQKIKVTTFPLYMTFSRIAILCAGVAMLSIGVTLLIARRKS